MGFTTKAFDLFYKRFGPTGSLDATWSFHNSPAVVSTGPSFARVSKSFLNFPEDGAIAASTNLGSGITTTVFVTTRNSASNATFQALPWGSAAGDFLWNILTPSWSFTTGSSVEYPLPNGFVQWNLSYVSSSFFSREWSKQIGTNYQQGSSFGLITSSGYQVTSSWKIYDPKIFTAGNNFIYSGAHGNVGAVAPGYNITFPSVNSTSTSSVDNQYFDQSGGAGISKTQISQSLVTASINATDNTATGLRLKTEALKARRLYFPIPVSGSGTTRGTDYWFNYFTKEHANNIFNTNGGIYNVQFSLKRHIPTDHAPDIGSFMTVFIHNVIPQIPSSSACIDGALGWYPPANNIVTIGNQYKETPELSFLDIQTGFYIEKFNFNVIQYGYPAQLCIEASGSLADNAYFGIIVDEFKMCKIGVTTDPRFIKPTSIATTVIDFTQQISAGGGDLA